MTMNTRYILIGLGVVLLLLGIGVVTFFVFNQPSSRNGEEKDSPFGFFESPSNTPLEQEPTPSGGDVPTDSDAPEDVVTDFRTDGITIADPNNPGMYIIAGGDMPTETGAPYSIIYFEKDQQFNITLFKEPIAETRIAAEQELMARAGLSEDIMCRMKYWLAVPYSYNEFYAGRNLGFSFCPGAVSI